MLLSDTHKLIELIKLINSGKPSGRLLCQGIRTPEDARRILYPTEGEIKKSDEMYEELRKKNNGTLLFRPFVPYKPPEGTTAYQLARLKGIPWCKL